MRAIKIGTDAKTGNAIYKGSDGKHYIRNPKGVPKRDGSGKGNQQNMGRGGCNPPSIQQIIDNLYTVSSEVDTSDLQGMALYEAQKYLGFTAKDTTDSVKFRKMMDVQDEILRGIYEIVEEKGWPETNPPYWDPADPPIIPDVEIERFEEDWEEGDWIEELIDAVEGGLIKLSDVENIPVIVNLKQKYLSTRMENFDWVDFADRMRDEAEQRAFDAYRERDWNPNPMADSQADASEVTYDISNVEAIREAIVAELDAITLYEQLAEKTYSEVSKMLLDIAKEEKTHVGELQAMLVRFDEEQRNELTAGAEEAKEFLPNPPKSLFFPAKSSKYSKMISIASLPEAKKSLSQLTKEWNTTKSRDKKRRLISMATLAGNRIGALLKKSLRHKTRVEKRKILKLYLDWVAEHNLEDT